MFPLCLVVFTGRVASVGSFCLCIPCGGERLMSGFFLNYSSYFETKSPTEPRVWYFSLPGCQIPGVFLRPLSILCVLISFVNLTQTRFTWGEGGSAEESPPSD